MKLPILAVAVLALCPVLPDAVAAVQVVNEAAPVVEINGFVEILMADGTVRRVRKITGMLPDALRVMTDDGIGKIPLNTLHPKALEKLNSMVETPEQRQARLQREAAAQQQYRDAQALRERMAAEDNATSAAGQRAEAARQEAARQAAAEAYARQQQYLMEAQKIQDAQRAQRAAERAERQRILDAEEARQRQQYEAEVAAAQAQQAAAMQQQQQATAAAQANQVGPLAAMMSSRDRAASGVDKLDMNEQAALREWVMNPNLQSPNNNTWRQKLQQQEREVLAAWLNQKRFDNLSPAMKERVPGPGVNHDDGAVSSFLQGNFDGFAPGKIFHLVNGKAYQQTGGRTQSFYSYSNGTKVTLRPIGSGIYVMNVPGAGEVNVKYIGH
ncbi:hypothetical protein [Prosthecobacter sp.]|uniref:hypothetical protein n=1 Tax=Prosthecobacter sp. TaxID=1965333 RepID=UPI003783C4A7